MSKTKKVLRTHFAFSRTAKLPVVFFSLFITAVLVTGFLLRWKSVRATTGTLATTGVTTLPLPQSTPTPTFLSKEYIYLNGRLVATEQPYLEADANPRPDGSGSVTVSDWTRVGRFVAGLDVVNVGSEFQRADCAPRSTLGDGKLTVSDWVQAGRYAAGLDPLTLSGGPIQQARLGPSHGAGDRIVFALALPAPSFYCLIRNLSLAPATQTGRIVRVLSPSFVQGQNGTVTVQLDSQGNENAVGLSVNFSTAQLTFVSAVKGSDASSATLNVNSSSVSSGKVGLALSLSSGQTFASGTKQIILVTFTASTSGSHVVTTGDQPVWREIADTSAAPLAATFTP